MLKVPIIDASLLQVTCDFEIFSACYSGGGGPCCQCNMTSWDMCRSSLLHPYKSLLTWSRWFKPLARHLWSLMLGMVGNGGPTTSVPPPHCPLPRVEAPITDHLRDFATNMEKYKVV